MHIKKLKKVSLVLLCKASATNQVYLILKDIIGLESPNFSLRPASGLDFSALWLGQIYFYNSINCKYIVKNDVLLIFKRKKTKQSMEKKLWSKFIEVVRVAYRADASIGTC
jgi:hypothetical protein